MTTTASTFTITVTYTSTGGTNTVTTVSRSETSTATITSGTSTVTASSTSSTDTATSTTSSSRTSATTTASTTVTLSTMSITMTTTVSSSSSSSSRSHTLTLSSVTQSSTATSATQTRSVTSVTQTRTVTSGTETKTLTSVTETSTVTSATQTITKTSATKTTSATTSSRTSDTTSVTQTATLTSDTVTSTVTSTTHTITLTTPAPAPPPPPPLPAPPPVPPWMGGGGFSGGVSAWSVEDVGEEEPAPSVKSTLVIVGTDQPVAGLKNSLRSSISGTLGVSSDNVEVSDPQPTSAAMVQGDVGTFRRLQDEPRILSKGLMQPALEAEFEVFVEADPEADPASPQATGQSLDTKATSLLDAMLEAVETLKSDPMPLLKKVESELAKSGTNLTENFTVPMQARVATPKVKQQVVRSVAGPWGPCGGAGVVCAWSGNVVLRFRNVWCADAGNLTDRVHDGLCSESTRQRSSEPCPASVEHPPACGWQIGNWSRCISPSFERPAALEELEGDLCDSSGRGQQFRKVHCLSEHEPMADETAACVKQEGKQPNTERTCYCAASITEAAPAQTEMTSAEAFEDTSLAMAGLGPLVMTVLGLGGLVLVMTCCLGIRRVLRPRAADKIAPDAGTGSESRDNLEADPYKSAALAGLRSAGLDSRLSVAADAPPSTKSVWSKETHLPGSPAAARRSPMSSLSGHSGHSGSPATKSPSAVSQSPKKSSVGVERRPSREVSIDSAASSVPADAGSRACSKSSQSNRRGRPTALSDTGAGRTSPPSSSRRAAWFSPQQSRPAAPSAQLPGERRRSLRAMAASASPSRSRAASQGAATPSGKVPVLRSDYAPKPAVSPAKLNVPPR
eukprot:TRINITY_DN2732_c0_g1_i10.p1 TRINITY_DN2732_c0_g1~~TRINITY_DN2732_c0_g1_i10.p1  ORF type:complete len:851 (+),score=157.09 TRINITY_DN2732_c0_g1_i10:898-3450(+)